MKPIQHAIFRCPEVTDDLRVLRDDHVRLIISP